MHTKLAMPKKLNGRFTSLLGAAFLLAAGGLAGASTSATAQTRSATEPGTRVMTCHPLFRGVPMEEPATYILRGDTMTGADGGIISTPQMRLLGSSVYKGRRSRTWAKHIPVRDGVIRQVYWEGRNGKPYLRFSERYDFARQTIVDPKEGKDSCYHNAYRR